MSDRSAKLRLGGFVAASFAALTGLVFLFGGTPRLFDNRARYVVTFGEAPGIGPGTPVRKSGVRIGEVTGLDLDEQSGQVKVQILVDKRFLPRTNEEATIFRGILSGDTSLDFLPKAGPDGVPISVRGETIAPDAELNGITPLNPNQIARQMTGVLPTAQESMARILQSVQRVEQAVPKIEKAFEEFAGLARSGREFVPELRKTNDKAQALLAFADVPADPNNLAETQAGAIRQTLNELRDTLKTAKPLIEDIRRVIGANEADITATVKAVRSTAEGANKFLNDDNRLAVSDTLRNLRTSSDELTKTIRLAASFISTTEKAVTQITGRLPQIDKVLGTIDRAVTAAEGTVKDFGETAKSARGAVKNIETATKPLAENAEQLTRNAVVVSEQLGQAIIEVRQTLRVLTRADGTLGKVISDPALYNQLNESAANLNRVLVRAEKVAADLQVFSDKIARRPETIGVGGAIRPSAGLKESPTAPSSERPIPPAPLPPNSGGSSFRRPGDLPPN